MVLLVQVKKKKRKSWIHFTQSKEAMGPALSWIEDPIQGYRLVLIEEKSHFNHVFAFPRASVISGFEHELFIPYDNVFSGDETIGKVVRARASAIHEDYVELDRDVPGFGKRVDYAYLVYCAGTKIPAPGRFNDLHTKEEGIAALKRYQKAIEQSERPVVIGAGAVGLGKQWILGEMRSCSPRLSQSLLLRLKNIIQRSMSPCFTLVIDTCQDTKSVWM